MKRYIVIRKNFGHSSGNEGENGKNEFWNNEDYHEYHEKHGLHFSEKLAMWASDKMVNADGTKHSWSVEDVKGAFKSLGYEKPEKCTWGDATYLANMYYSDFMPMLKTETDAVKMAYMIMKDPDGYDGMAFNRWTADIMTKNENVDWKSVM